MMKTITIAVAITALCAAPLKAQERSTVISANPFGLLLGLANGEVEHVVSESGTIGVGGSWYNSDNDDYVNGDAFYRYYPGGKPLQGWAFGVKAGLTHLVDSGTRFGYGFDVNHSWITGRNHNFYVGLGFGLKRLVGDKNSDWDLNYIPTFRIINVGVAF